MSKVIYYLSGPHINVESGYWLYDKIKDDGYEIKPYYLYRFGHSRDKKTRIRQITETVRLLCQSKRKSLIVLYDVTQVFIIMGLLANILRLDRNIVAINFMGNGSSHGYEKWKRPIIRYALHKMRIGVNNESLIRLYASQLKINQSAFFVIQDCCANVDESNKPCEPSIPHYVFMGGNVHRDWKLFKDIVKLMPNINFVAVLKTTDLDDCTNFPNLTIYKQVPLKWFNELVAQSYIVLLPLTTEVQAGQLVAFQGSMYRKPVVISHCVSIDSYYSNEDAIKVGINDLEGCVNAVNRLMNDKVYYNTMAKNGYECIKRLTPEKIYKDIKSQFYL